MQLGMIGLGRMGGNIVRRLMKHGHSTVVYDKDPKAVAAISADGAVGSSALEDFVKKLEKPRTAWVMLPAGKITEATIDALSKLMAPGDVIIDGGNTFWQDDVRRGKALKERGLHYIDVGTSGGGWSIDRGYCMIISGVNAAIDDAVPAEVLTAALFARFRSRKEHTFAEKILSAMRDGFGGHKEPQQHADPAPQSAPDIVKPKAGRS